jgi:hypothetical protein
MVDYNEAQRSRVRIVAVFINTNFSD